MPVDLRTVPADAPEAVRLLAEYGAEIASMYGGADVNAPGMPKAGPTELGPPHGAFVIGYAAVPDFNGNPLASWWGEKAL